MTTLPPLRMGDTVTCYSGCLYMSVPPILAPAYPPPYVPNSTIPPIWITSYGGTILTGSHNTFFQFKPAARVGDYTNSCVTGYCFFPKPFNPILTGSKSVFINNLPAAYSISEILTSIPIPTCFTIFIGI